MKKKGFIFAMMMFVIVIIVFGIVSIWGYKLFSDMSSDMLTDLELNQSKQVISDMDNRYPSALDGLFAFLFVGMVAVCIVSAFVSDTHPILFAFMVIIMIFMTLAGTILGNFYEEFFQDAEFTGLTDSFPITNWILTHMLIIGIFTMTTVMLVLLGKNRM